MALPKNDLTICDGAPLTSRFGASACVLLAIAATAFAGVIVPARAGGGPGIDQGASQNTGQSAGACTRTDFENVVDAAGNALRDLNRQNKPQFQDTLRQLKDARGWDHATFLDKAKPFVADQAINTYNHRSEQLLKEIASLGSVNASTDTPDCAVLIELRARMTLLVKTQTEKWSYMFGKLKQALDAGAGN